MTSSTACTKTGPGAVWQRRDRALARAGAAVRRTVVRLPPPVQVLLVFAVTRVLVAAVAHNARLPRRNGQGYIGRIDGWDGRWYRSIVEGGYPVGLPFAPDGSVPQNAWAFSPLFPALSRLLVDATGWDFAVAATVLNLLCGAVAVVLVRAVVDEVAGPVAAFWTATFLCCAPAAPVLQFAYSESVALLLVAGTLRALQRGQAFAAAALIAVAGLARPVGVPLAVLAGVHAVRLLRRDPVTGRTRCRACALVVAGAFAVLCWPAVVALRTGVPDGFLASQLAWRGDDWSPVGGVWLPAARALLGEAVGTLAVVAVVPALVAVLTGPRLRALGADLWVWTASYLAYLWPTTAFVSCLPRFLLLAFPLLVLVSPRRAAQARGPAIAVMLLVTQVLWLRNVWPYPPLRHPGPP